MSQLVHGGKYVHVCCRDRGSESQYIYITVKKVCCFDTKKCAKSLSPVLAHYTRYCCNVLNLACVLILYCAISTHAIVLFECAEFGGLGNVLF